MTDLRECHSIGLPRTSMQLCCRNSLTVGK